ncbi:MAG: type IX secretion system sortase PorU, partial [Bacteroidetes bacterium]|nr:type IX secretion system sortase PorU [Bacteroidota bacterium]
MTKSIYLKLIIPLSLFFFLCIFLQEGQGQQSPWMVKEFTDHSVLSSGNWYKISVVNTGVHKLSYDELLAMGFDLQGTDPRYIQLYGNGNGMVPESNAQARYDDLMENAVVVVGEEDGVFDPQDYILFYGLGPEIWKYNYFTGLFEHQVNFYTEETFYFLTIGQSPGRRIIADSLITQDPEYFIQEFTDYAVHEEENINILKSGKLWWGEHYKSQLTYEYAFHFPNVINQEKISLRTNVAARSTENSNFDYFYEGLPLVTAEVSKINLNSTIYAWSITPDTASFYPNSDNVSITVTYNPTSIIAEGWMNYIELNARRQLKMAAPQQSFRDHRIYGTGKVAQFRIQDAPAGLTVWDVTDRFAVTRVNGTYEDGDYIFKTHLDVLREFIAFDGTSFHSASFIEEVENQNLHAMTPAEYIIVTAPEFYDQAVRLGQLHQQVDGLSFLIVTPQQIYNEFSSGAQDISAIRDFCRMLYQRAEQGNQPGYLLLFGDGSYDPKCRAVPDCNHIPTFQSLESLKFGYSFVTEDFFALYDNDEGNNAYGKTVDLGVGRFPVNTYEEARQVVDKIQHYLNGQAKVTANWRNRICFIADDEDNNTHFKQAEKLQAIIDTGYINYNIDKIYIDAYRQISTPSGNRYPEVNEAIT